MKTLPLVKFALVKRGLAMAGAVVMLGMAGEARGQTTTTWNGTVNNDWNLIGNWFLTVPTSLDTVYIDTNSGNQPILDDETGAAENLYVGETGASGANTLLTVQDGAVLTVGGTFIMGDQFGATGAVTTTGFDTEMYLTNGGIVGNSSVGLLTVGDSSTVDGGNEELDVGKYAGSSGTVDVNGGNLGNVSTLVVGDSGAGNLTVENEGTVSATSIVVSEQALGAGNVTVDGTGSNLYAGSLNLGFFGNGTMSVDHGGAGTTTGYLYLGAYTDTTGTLTVNGTGSKFTAGGTAYIGGTGTGNLAITNGGVFNGSAGISVGDQIGSVGNVSVDGTGSQLLLGGATSYVGNSGNGTLSVTNGAVVDGGGAELDLGENASGNGTVEVNGGTLQNVSNLFVGYAGNGTLTMESGGNVTAGAISIGDRATGNGTVTVDGTGTELQLGGATSYVGHFGKGALNVTNGAVVDGGDGQLRLGESALATGTVTLNGGTLMDLEFFFVGDNGNGTVTVENGGNLTTSTVVIVGYASTGTGIATVDGAGSSVTSPVLYIGYVGGNGTMTVDHGATVTSTIGLYVGHASGSQGTLTVNGTGSAFYNQSTDIIGETAIGNLAITNGGSYYGNISGISVGDQSGGSGTVTVDGAGSQLLLGGSTSYVGNSGNGSLSVTNEGSVDGGGVELDLGTNATGNGTAVVDDASLGNIGFLDVGVAGYGNLTVQDGGNVSATSVTLGDQSTGNGAMLVTGAGTIINGTLLVVGDSGNGALAINASAIWDNGGGPVDEGDALGSNGAIVVNGGTFQDIGLFDVGCCGNGTLAILAGGNVVASSMDVGVQSMGENASVVVNGAGSTLYLTIGSGSTGLTVGDGATGAMLVSNQGLVDLGGADLMVGAQGGYYGNLTVDNGTVQNIGTLTAGEAGIGNLTVDDGGNVTASTLVGGDQNGAVGNFVITGPNTTVTLSGSGFPTVIGNSGSANLSVTDFAILDNGGQDAHIGGGTTGSGNVAVSGGGQWKNLGYLSVGFDGTGTLTVTSSGSLTAGDIFVGSDSSTSSGLVTVSGANTTVGVTDYIEVGDNGPGEFDIKNGANVTTGYVTLANNFGGPGNMTVDGTNSTLNITNVLEVGDSDMGNLTISGGANVTVSEETELGGESTGTGNIEVTGFNTTLTTGDVYIGTFGNGTLTVEDGGTVTLPPGNSIVYTLGSGTGTVNVGSAGTLQVGGANGIDPGAGTSTFNMLGGTVRVIGSDFSTAINATLATSTTSIIDTNGFNATWAGNIAGGGKLSKYGLGTLTLSGVDTYSGCTTVTLGRLDVTGSLASVVMVNSVATLGGNGTVSNSVTLATGASVAPAYGGPSLTLGNLTWGGSMNGTATAIFTLSDVNNTASLLTVLGNFAKGTGTTFKFDFSGTGTGSNVAPETYTLISYGALADAGNGLFNISDFSYQNLGGMNTDGTFAFSGNNLTFTVVPEPGVTAVGMGLLALGMVMWVRRKRG